LHKILLLPSFIALDLSFNHPLPNEGGVLLSPPLFLIRVMSPVKASALKDFFGKLSIKIRPYWPEIGRSSLCALASLIAVTFTVCVPLALQGHAWFSWPDNWHYADSDNLMISGADGYLFLSQASKALSEGLSFSTPALSLLAVILSIIFRASIENTAFFANLFFTICIAFLLRAWCRRLGAGLSLSVLACIIISLMPAWVQRSGPSWFDTDPGIVFLWNLEIYFLTLAADLSRDFKTRKRDLGAAVLTLALFVWFWNSAFFLGGVITLVYWFMFMTPWKPLWRFKAFPTLVTIGIIWFALIVLIPEPNTPFPSSLAEQIKLKGAMVFGVEKHFFFSSIQELAPASFSDWLVRLGGYKISGIIIIISALAVFITLPKFRMPLVLGFGFSAAGLVTQRLIYFGAFPLALSVAFLPKSLRSIGEMIKAFWSQLTAVIPLPVFFGRFAEAFNLRILWAKLPNLSILAIPSIIIVILSCAWWSGHRGFPIRWNKFHDEIFAPIREAGIKGASFCNWWDDGYFILARSGQRPFFNGGTQNPETTFAAAHPWMMLDRVAAARWMRFFSRRGLKGLEPLEKVWGKDPAFARLEQLFLAVEPDGSLRPGANYPWNLEEDLAKLPGRQAWLFPEGRVFVFFPREMFDINPWWISMGYSRPADRSQVRHHISIIGRNEFQFNPESRNLTLSQELKNRGYQNFGDVIDTSVTPLGPPWNALKSSAPYIIYNQSTNYAFIVDQLGLICLPVYLMLPGGPELPNFKLIKVNYNVGGIWEVLP
jgi:hypothetical protein